VCRRDKAKVVVGTEKDETDGRVNLSQLASDIQSIWTLAEVYIEQAGVTSLRTKEL